jgi:hypothetical protein
MIAPLAQDEEIMRVESQKKVQIVTEQQEDSIK